MFLEIWLNGLNGECGLTDGARQSARLSDYDNSVLHMARESLKLYKEYTERKYE